jgi:hypothetical protein
MKSALLARASLDEAISHVATNPAGCAYIEPAGRVSWAAYDGYITLLAARLLSQGLETGDRSSALSSCRQSITATGQDCHPGPVPAPGATIHEADSSHRRNTETDVRGW